MTYAATQGKNSGPGNEGIAANFGACPIETSGIVNAGVLKIAGTAVAAPPGTAITQTYSTATATHSNITTTSPSTTLILTGTNIAAKTASLTLIDAVNTNAGTVATSLDQAQKDIGTALNTIRVELAAAVADILVCKKIINQIVDDLQVVGIES